MMYTTAKILLDSVDQLNQRITTMQIKFPRTMLAEFNTHRRLSKNAGCVAEDTIISLTNENNQDIVWLFNKFCCNEFSFIELKCWNKITEEFITTKVTNVVYSGKKHVYEIELKNGYRLKCTVDHRLLSTNGWITLADIMLREDTSNIILFVDDEYTQNHSKLCSYKYIGLQDTYDIEVENENHNFIANGIVVHNSSRAQPFNKVIEQIENVFYEPEDVRYNEKGMQGNEKLSKIDLINYHYYHRKMWNSIKEISTEMYKNIKPHKQHINRYSEAFTYIDMVVTSTEWNNLFAQRNHYAAYPEFQLLAEMMQKTLEQSVPKELNRGDWHLPYILPIEENLDIYTKIMISIARCARVSFNPFDENNVNIIKDIELFFKLFHANPPHASPFEHVAMCVNKPATEDFLWGDYIQFNTFYNHFGWMSFRFLWEKISMVEKCYNEYIDFREFKKRFGA